MNKTQVLFVSPVAPSPSGSGRAMRAWAWVDALSQRHDVHVLVVRGPEDAGASVDPPMPAGPVASLRVVDPPDARGGRWLRAVCRLAPILVLWWPRGLYFWVVCTPEIERILRDQVGSRSIERIVCFRMYLHAVARCARTICHPREMDLDLDDLDGPAQASIGRALWRRGRWREGLLHFTQACQFQWLARATLKHYDRVYLAAPDDARQLQAAMPSLRTAVFPNKVFVTSGPWPLPPGPPLRLLFAGAFDHAPNRDAAEFLLTEIVPRLRQRLPDAWQLTLAGRRPSRELVRQCQGNPAVVLAGDPPDMAPLYAAAHAVLVPLRAGGGTKIKTLEAMAYGRVVVSTAQGVRGLAAVPYEHYVPAETAADFAQACAGVAADLARAQVIAAAGRALVQSPGHAAEPSANSVGLEAEVA